MNGQNYESKLFWTGKKLVTSFLVLLPDFITEIFLHGCDIESGRPGNEAKRTSWPIQLFMGKFTFHSELQNIWANPIPFQVSKMHVKSQIVRGAVHL